MKSINHIIIGLAVIISAFLFSSAWKKSHKERTSINVTGLASHDFNSDLIVWKATFNRKASTIQEAYSNLKKDAEIIKKYLNNKGVKQNELVFSAVNIEKEFETIYEGENKQHQVFKGYNLSQGVEIESKEVDKIENISREVTELIDEGVELYSGAPQYFFTKLSDLKIKLLADATSDAKKRADKIAENAGSSIGKLRVAEMGIFQITAQNSNEDYSWGGAFNTTSKSKTASITVKLEFTIE